MRITNKWGLPEPAYQAIVGKKKEKIADYSVTELISPPRIRELERRHDDKLEMDVTELVYAAAGTALHQKLSTGAPEVKPLIISVVVGNRVFTISGEKDLPIQVVAGGKQLIDYKFTSVWSYILGARSEWEQQLQMYNAFEFLNCGVMADKLANWLFFRDWSLSKTSDPAYPQAQALPLFYEPWLIEKTLEFIKRRILLHQLAEAADADADIPECSPDERWERPGKWALMKPGRKSAVKLYEPDQKPTEIPDKHSLVWRPGKNVRCESYCIVGRAGLCNQWNQIREQSNQSSETGSEE